MRVLLVALNVQKGDLDGNLALHLAMLEKARAQRCDVAVFPEFSLTGSVDPRRHPERALTVDAEPVRKLLKATWQTGVAVVFGIAERVDGAFHISQVYGHSGRLDGVYRKRYLAEDEPGYQPGETAGVFQFGSAKFGVTICAEGGVDFPWNDAVAGGAEVVFFCSAPGLYRRRTDEHSWRDGHAWWVSEGLGQAVQHARRLAVPVAMATQAGSTEDEDFPGLAALVLPSGEVALLTRSGRPSVVWSSTRAVVRYSSVMPTAKSSRAGGFHRAEGWSHARITTRRSAGSCKRSWAATTSRSARGSGGAAIPSGWAGG
jgi:predicted amidohydrolase